MMEEITFSFFNLISFPPLQPGKRNLEGFVEAKSNCGRTDDEKEFGGQGRFGGANTLDEKLEEMSWFLVIGKIFQNGGL